MKNFILTLIFAATVLPLSAQRFAYVDTDYILENLPEYNQAQTRLKTQTEQWNQEIQNRQNTVTKRQADLLNEKVLLTDDQYQKEQEEIDKELRVIKQLQEKRYGQDGDLIKLRKTLVKPIQDQIYLAVDDVAQKRNYSFVFDKGSDLIMVYTDPKFDISREVLLQLNPNAIEKQTKDTSNSSGSSNKSTPNNRKSNANSGKSNSNSGKATNSGKSNAKGSPSNIKK